MNKSSRSSLTIRYIVLFGALLVLTNVILGVVLMAQSTTTLQNLVRQNMRNVSDIAAGIVDGDALEALTEKDAGSAAYQEILDQLTVFQNHADIEYIYAYREDRPGHFVFTVDADPHTPADFGEEVVSTKVTKALLSAAEGIAAVDTERSMDEWGYFYSSYSPVFDSDGAVAGIIGVDFSSEWYDLQVRQHMTIIAVFSGLSILAGLLFIVIINRRVRRRFSELSRELTALTGDLEELTEEVLSDPFHKGMREQDAAEKEAMMQGTAAEDAIAQNAEAKYGHSKGVAAGSGSVVSEGGEDEIEELSRKIGFMQQELRACLDYAHAQVHTDALTGVGNTVAYIERQGVLEEKMRDGTADFAVAVFDINDLKTVNDRFGHACGDRIIRGAAAAIASVFGREHTFRIGGDEFCAVAENCTREDMQRLLEQTDRAIAAFNRTNGQENPAEAAGSVADSDAADLSAGTASETPKQENGKWIVLSVSSGAAACRPAEDRSFRDVFTRADGRMYQMKKQFHHRA